MHFEQGDALLLYRDGEMARWRDGGMAGWAVCLGLEQCATVRRRADQHGMDDGECRAAMREG
jgi:hypothetical protein